LGVDDNDVLNSVESAPCFLYRSARTAGEKDTHDDEQDSCKRMVRPVGSRRLMAAAGLIHWTLQGFVAVSVVSDLLAPIHDRAIEEFFKKHTHLALGQARRPPQIHCTELRMVGRDGADDRFAVEHHNGVIGSHDVDGGLLHTLAQCLGRRAGAWWTGG